MADHWIQTRLQKVIKSVEETIIQYRFDLFAQTVYEFTWNEYCNWYVEFTKCVLYNKMSNPSQLRSTRITLLEVLETLLRLLHPIIPFITAEIWQIIAPLVGKRGKSIMVESWPQLDASKMHHDMESDVEWLKNIIIAVRTLRAKIGISPEKEFQLFLKKVMKKIKNG